MTQLFLYWFTQS